MALCADTSGAIVLEELLKNDHPVPLCPDVRIRELVLNTAWYISWERRQATHGEEVQLICDVIQ